MLRLYKELPEFGGFLAFDTISGSLSKIDEKKFKELEQQTPAEHCFYGNSSTHTSFFRRAYFQITRRCNLLCDHCFIKADPYQSDLDVHVIERLTEYLGRKGLMEVRLSGGEPTIHEDFIHVAENFMKNNIYVSVGTNGLWPKKVLEYFKSQKNIWLVVSIEGNEDTHNAIRPNSYSTIIKNLTELRKANPYFRLRINMVLCRKNLKDLEHMAKLTQQFNAESVVLIPLRAQVRTKAYLDNMLSGQEFCQAIQQMVTYKEKYGINFSTTVKHYARKHIVMDELFTKTSSCAAGREGTNIDFDASKRIFRLYGCSYCPASDPKVPEALRAPFTAGEAAYDDLDSIERIWNDDNRWAIFRDLSHKADDCRSCEYFPGYCEGSCPTLNFDISQLDLNKNVATQLKQQLRKNGEWYCYKKLKI